MNLSLSPRLYRAAQYIRGGSVFADIGTDHAYLPIYAILSHKCTFAVASDINEGPLDRAKVNIASYGLNDCIKCVLTSGFDGINGFTDAAVCGMGGDLISEIIKKAGHTVARDGVRLILQPMTHPDAVRECILSLGFNIFEEYTTIDLGKYYTVICADYDGVVRCTDEFTYMYGDFNIKRFESDEVRCGFLMQECSKLERIIKGKSTSKIDTSHEKYMLDKLYELLRKE